MASLDPDLLQLSELSPLALNSNPFLAEELFSLWLSLPETSRLVKNLLNDVKTGSFSNATANSAVSTATSLPSTFPSSSTPSLGPPLKLVSEPVREVIPQAVTKDICKLLSFFSTAQFRKIDVNDSGIVTRDQFVNYWIGGNLLTMDIATQVYTVLKQPHCRYLTRGDFEPILHELLASIPGWSFYEAPEFQERFAETVVYRIFYQINRSGTGHLTLRELKCDNLISAMQHVDEEEDINKVLRYFSYGHFYVIYCKFWELDIDHDFFIDKENLIRYGNHALTYRIVDRIFPQVPRKFGSKVKGKMGYEDFVYFILSEEDKSLEPGLEYWFKCIDLDGNGVLTSNEVQFFYEEQLHRMECMAQETVLFEDILCQIVDMIRPEKEDYISLCDLKSCKLSGHVYILFNLIKFIAFETRDPFLIHQERENLTLTEWDRFAHREFIRLSMEEDIEDASNGSGDIWEESFEAPF